MKKLSRNLAMYICMFVVVFCAMTLKVEAATVTTGTLGDNDGITWTYDADTKTLTITGEDSGLVGKKTSYEYTSPFEEICERVETIIVKDCTLEGSACALFANLRYLKRIDFNNFDTTDVTDMSNMFSRDYNLTGLDLSSFDTGNVTDMSSMFELCDGLTNLDLSGFDTENVTNMYFMFRECDKLNDVNLSNLNTSNVTNMYGMFWGCTALENVDVSNFDTANVKDISHMFDKCENLKSVDVSAFVTSKVTSMTSMFEGCSNLTDLDTSNFNTSNVTSMQAMFRGCEKLSSLDVSKFDTSQVRFFYGMFDGCSSLTSLDLSSFNFVKSQNHRTFLDDCDNLAIIHTPKAFNSYTSLQLPAEYVDSNNNRTSFITKDNCDTILINVNCLVSGIQLSGSAYIPVGGAEQLSLVATPQKAVLKTVTWKSSDTAVATVDANGKVTAVACGTATITATATDLMGTSVSASCTVTVAEPEKEPEPETPETPEEKVRAFVERMYTVALGRAAESEGLEFYTQRLLSGDSNGACIAESFLCSPEFLNKGYNDAEYVKVLYRTFFDREPAAEEVNYWVEKLASGQTRAFVLSGFVNSVEFDNLCTSYGISRGFMREDGKPLNPGIGRFAERLYTVVLERAGEKEGIEYWSLNMANGVCTPKDAAKSFFLSQEYINKNTSDAQYITTLYRTFMDREPEAGGVEYWQNVLNNGATREQILEGFADSAEFKGIMASFGL